MSIQSEPRTRLISDLAAELAAAGPALDEPGQRIAVTLYRLLADGSPVQPAELATRVGMPVERVTEALDSWPGIYRNDQGAVIGFWGLSLGEMPHRLIVDGRALYTWCAWDALFIPTILGKPGRVESTCAVTGEPVTMTVTPHGVEDVSSLKAALSLLRPDGAFGDDVISSFCHHIVFFRSRSDGDAWTATRPGTFVFSLKEGFQLGQLTWRGRLGAALDEPPLVREETP